MAETNKKLVILGFDGLDPHLLQTYVAEGKLPHFKNLIASGAASPLQTSNPPQSPVAWASFISGADPGVHDVFDFVIRNPKTYLPEVGMTEEKKGDSVLKKVMAGLSGPSLQTRRKGPAFWTTLGEKGIKSVILRMPMTFPAEPLNGRLLSGMGTPDLRGTQGYSTYYSTRKTPAGEIHGKWVEVSFSGVDAHTQIFGPWVQAATGRKEASVPLSLTKTSKTQLDLRIDQKTVTLKPGDWSPWVPVEFKTGPFQSVKGIVKFHLNGLEPNLELFMTPVNLDPHHPAFPISHPDTYAGELCDHFGHFYTQGMPYDTWALNENRLSEEDFLDQAYAIVDEQEKSLDFELSRFDGGLLFCYFGATDLIQHMFWRYMDPDHPSPAKNASARVRNAIPDVYKRADDIVGRTLARLSPGTGLLVLSDHGFGSFRRSVHLNSWLRDNGFLTLKSGQKAGEEFFTNVDWSQTQAYSVGFGGIYINQFGREKSGVVYKGVETESLKNEIQQKLLAWKDKNGKPVVKKVYSQSELYHGAFADNGPDLFVGFHLPFRASWQTGLGAAPELLIEDNTRAWSGDHLCDPSEVPGVFIHNGVVKNQPVSLSSVSDAILGFFGVAR